MTDAKKAGANPFLWAGLILALAQGLTLAVAIQEKVFFEQSQVTSPGVSAGLALIYFVAVLGVMTLVLALVPISWLKLILRLMFTFTFGWGVLVILGFYLPVPVAGLAAVAVGFAWFLAPRVWLHNLVLMLALVAAAAIFGFLVRPWTFVAVMLVVSVYDILAVRFGYMLWMARRLSESTTLPAFIIPAYFSGWRRRVTDYSLKMPEGDEPPDKDFSVLGGGDIGFPLVMAVSVLFDSDLVRAAVVAGFSLLGLALAYWIQTAVLKGRPLPALPPIAAATIAGFLVAYYLI